MSTTGCSDKKPYQAASEKKRIPFHMYTSENRFTKMIQSGKCVCYLQNLVGMSFFACFSPAKISRLAENISLGFVFIYFFVQ
jgi:hypothetical protein